MFNSRGIITVVEASLELLEELPTMKLFISTFLLSSTLAFSPHAFKITRGLMTLLKEKQAGFDLSGNSWKPDSGKMGSTDTGDYFPEGYENDIAFNEGMMGSQAMLGGGNKSPQLPGMENLGADAIMMGGIDEAGDIPKGMEFIASSVPDDEFKFEVAGSSDGTEFVITVKPFCMSYEDYYAAFTKDSHRSFRVTPSSGRMDRRGGQNTLLTVKCEPKGQSGTLTGFLVINIPEDNSKLTYKITANSF